MATNSTWLTPDAAAKLREELEKLEGPGRVEITARIAEARSHGDLRENPDYDAAKNEQGMMEARIRQIRHILENAVIREVEDTGVVQVGSVVTVVDGDGDTLEYFVASPENKAPGLLLASPHGPLGQALMGAAVGDEVSYDAPAGTFTLEIAAVRPYEG